VCFLNRSKLAKPVTYAWKGHRISDELSGRSADFGTSIWTLRDLWAHKEIGSTKKDFVTVIPAHDVRLLRLSPQKK
ncbi:MAG TPA: glycoside hydrolase family 27 protein, partial [bacterium]|nr:glycoside hydrolase family 27 protein [bacterium]